MTLLSKENTPPWHDLILLLFSISLPWPIGFSNLSLALLGLVWVVQGQWTAKWNQFRKSLWVWAYVWFFGVILVLTYFSSGIDETLSEGVQKITFLLLPVILATSAPLSTRAVHWVKRGFVYSCVAIVMVSLVIAWIHLLTNNPIQNFDSATDANFNRLHPISNEGWMHFSYIQLLKWVDLHPTYFSMYLVFCLILLMHEQFVTRLTRYLHQAIAVVIATFIILLSSRIAILALGLFLAISIIRNTIQRKKGSAFQALGLALVIGLVLWANPVSKFRFIEEPALTEYQLNRETTNWNSVNYRLLEWKASFTVIRENPIIGVGPIAAQETMNNFYHQFNASTVNVNYNAHNQYLQTWMELGMIGLISLLSCLFIPLFYPRLEKTHVAFILIFSFMCTTESLLERQKGIVFFAFFQSVMICSPKKAA